MRIIEKINGFEIVFDFISGDKGRPALIFLHGWPHNRTMWGSIAEYFNKIGFSTLVVDLRGNGMSSKLPGRQLYTIENAEGDLMEVLRRTGIQNYMLFGHSFGAMTALWHALMRPSINLRGLVLCSAGYQSPLKTIFGMNLHFLRKQVLVVFSLYVFLFFKIFRKWKYYNFNKFKIMPTVVLHAMGMRAASFDSVTGNFYSMCGIFDISDRIAEITVPILIFGGSRDLLLPLKNGRFIAAKARNASFVKISGDHTLMLKKSDKLIPIVEKFISRIS
jgi:pimeloyl-ACP methyl ester carboxylesterase